MNGMTLSEKQAAAPQFWRDEALPFVEARSVQDGRKVCYAKHAHDTFSIGAITTGRSTYLNGTVQERVGAGVVVVINPEDVHACNPIDDQRWSYVMFFVDVPWLIDLQHELGLSQGHRFRAFSTTMTTRPDLYAGLRHLYAILTDAHADPLQKHSATLAFFSDVQFALHQAPAMAGSPNAKLVRAEEYIREHFRRSLKLDEISAAAELSASYLIRAFKERYGMTPHAYLVNRRIEYSRSELRRGRAIADVAIDAGFSDQAHLQRAFRQFMAVTPRQYRG